MNNLISNLLTSLFKPQAAWWIEIKTECPSYTYYFGPFSSRVEAVAAESGFIEDLTHEGAQQIQAKIQLSPQPKELTISNAPE